MSGLKIGEVSRRATVGVEAIRYYERLGLLGSPRRTESGYRLYGEGIFTRLDFIRKAQAMEASTLEEIAAHHSGEREGPIAACADVRRIRAAQARRAGPAPEAAPAVSKRAGSGLTMTEWDRKGSAAGKICGLIEQSHVGHVPEKTVRRKA